MAKRSYRPEQIIKKLREAEVLLCQGSSVGEAARKMGVTEQTYYRWRREYGGMRIGEVRRLKELEKENAGLKIQSTPSPKAEKRNLTRYSPYFFPLQCTRICLILPLLRTPIWTPNCPSTPTE